MFSNDAVSISHAFVGCRCLQIHFSTWQLILGYIWGNGEVVLKKYLFLLIFGDRCFADPFAWYNQVDHWTCDSEECVCRTFWKVSKYPLPQLIFAFKSKSMLLKKCILIPYRTPVFLFEVALPLCNYHFDCAYWCTGVPVSSFMLVGASGLTTRKICFVFKGRSCMPNRSYHGLGWCSRWVNMHNKQV